MNQKLVGRKICELRKARQLSVRGLARKADLSASFLSSIEAGKTSPSLASFLKILEALGTTAPEFFADQEQPSIDAVHFRQKDMTVIADGEKLSRFLFPDTENCGCLMSYEEYRPHTTHHEREAHPRDLCILVLSGVLTLEVPGRETYLVRTGDAAYLRAGQTHVSSNRHDQLLRIVVVELKRMSTFSSS